MTSSLLLLRLTFDTLISEATNQRQRQWQEPVFANLFRRNKAHAQHQC